MLMLHCGKSVSPVVRALCANRSSINRWINKFILYALEGLKNLPVGRPVVIKASWSVIGWLVILNLTSVFTCLFTLIE